MNEMNELGIGIRHYWIRKTIEKALMTGVGVSVPLNN